MGIKDKYKIVDVCYIDVRTSWEAALMAALLFLNTSVFNFLNVVMLHCESFATSVWEPFTFNLLKKYSLKNNLLYYIFGISLRVYLFISSILQPTCVHGNIHQPVMILIMWTVILLLVKSMIIDSNCEEFSLCNHIGNST